jgi:hypothetical protein
MPDEKTQNFNGLLITGLLALLGTVTGGVVKGYWDTNLANRDFQSKLILRALESEDMNKRISSLQFLVKTNLISDPRVTDGIKQAVKDGDIPRFEPVRQQEPGVSVVPSAKAQVIAENPALKGSILPLVALKVRHGDVIDSITPIFAEIGPDLRFKGQKQVGQRIGGESGNETILEREGCVITGVNVYRGNYFGRDEVIQIEVIWHKLTPQGIDPATEIVSEKLGSGKFAKISQPPKELRAQPGYYISDFTSSISDHTSGETFFNDISIKQEKLPMGN